MRVSREISLGSSLHRASTDALIVHAEELAMSPGRFLAMMLVFIAPSQLLIIALCIIMYTPTQ